MNKKVFKITQIIVNVVVLIILLIGNVLCGIYFNLITTYFGGYGIDTSKIDYTKGDEICQQIEAEGAVLLKNDNHTLPLKDTKKVNVFGWGSTDGGFVVSGSGSGASSVQDKATKFLSALEKEGFEYNKDLIKIYTDFKANRDTDKTNCFNLIEPTLDNQTIEKAKTFSDTAFVVLSRVAVETRDIPRKQTKYNLSTDTSKTYLEISNEERTLLNQVKTSFDKVIVLINSCNSMELGFLEEEGIDAALFIGAPGQSGCLSIAKILKGEINPSGRITDTYSYDHTTAGSYYFSSNGAEVNSVEGGVKSYSGTSSQEYYIDYVEGIYVGYKWYETADQEHFFDDVDNEYGRGYDGVVQYPFGYGLSYTNFAYTIKEISPTAGSKIDDKTEIKLVVNVKNVGDVDGKDVLEVYYGGEYHDWEIEKSSKNLVAFAKTDLLKKGDSQDITLSFKASDMKSYDYSDADSNGFTGYQLDWGEYNVYLSSDSHTLLPTNNSQIKYHVDETINLENDEVSNNKVENHFTGDEATDSGISIDGNNASQNISYLTRANFQKFTKSDTNRAFNNKLKEIVFSDKKNTDQTFNQNQPGDLKLYKDDSLNNELISILGNDYNAKEWEELLNQMSIEDMVYLINNGGYGSIEIASIGKPKFIDLDGPAGINDTTMTSKNADFSFFPNETIIGCTWNEELAYAYGLAVGKEASSAGIAGWYAPACNIHRSPYDGRNFEYYSEDPFISGKLAAMTIKGAIEQDLYCYVKHFVLNETEHQRSGLYTWLTEQTLRETYLKPFEIAVKEGQANAVMSSFNRIGATWTGGSYALLTEVLREEWGFKGTVITDNQFGWPSGMNVDQGLRAGNDLWLVSNSSSIGKLSTHTDTTSPTAIRCMRDACHNILYTYCNTAVKAKEASNKRAKSVPPYWIIGLVSLDIVVIGLVSFSCFKLFYKKKKVSIEID